MSTRAIRFLKQKKIPFQLVKYSHVEKGAEFAAVATGFPLSATVKTLVVDLGEKNTMFGIEGKKKVVNYTSLIPVLTKALQEQQEMISDQQKQIDELKTMVSTLVEQSKNN